MEKITLKNLEKYYYEPKGNLYYQDSNGWYVLDGFDLDEVKTAIGNGVEFIFVEGPARLIADNELELACN